MPLPNRPREALSVPGVDWLHVGTGELACGVGASDQRIAFTLARMVIVGGDQQDGARVTIRVHSKPGNLSSVVEKFHPSLSSVLGWDFANRGERLAEWV